MADSPGVALAAFNPTLWSAQMLMRLRKYLVFASPYVVNRDYQGEISEYGDTVKMHGIANVTVGTYTKDTDVSKQVLTGLEAILQINKAEYFDYVLDDLDARQNWPKVQGAASDEAAYELALSADNYVAGLLNAAVGQTALDTARWTSPAVVGSTSVPQPTGVASFADPTAGSDQSSYEFLVDLGTALDQVGVPRNEARYCIVPPWFTGNLAKDLRILGYGGANGNSVLNDGFAGNPDANGFAGRVAGFNVIQSLNIVTGSYTTPTGTPGTAYKAGAGQSDTYYKIVAGVPSATSFADQIKSNESFRSTTRFGTEYRGLHLYGAHVVWPERLAGAVIAKGV